LLAMQAPRTVRNRGDAIASKPAPTGDAGAAVYQENPGDAIAGKVWFQPLSSFRCLYTVARPMFSTLAT
jgi:hypothetical protein